MCKSLRVPYIQGSPPLTRGTLTNQSTAEDVAGITPAYAGNTACTDLWPVSLKDHPRLRGEHLLFSRYSLHNSGSPPLTRGTLKFTMMPSVSYRITPAYAGNTQLSGAGGIPIWDHPRLRGEHLFRIFKDFFRMGSPPLTRGTRQYT